MHLNSELYHWTHLMVCQLACQQEVLLHRLAIIASEAEQTASSPARADPAGNAQRSLIEKG